MNGQPRAATATRGPPPGLEDGTNSTTNTNGTTSSPGAPGQSSFGASGPEVIGVVWALVTIAACFLAARVIIKRRSRKGLWWDDVLLIASWVMLALFASATTYCVHVGLGSHSGARAIQQTPLQLWTIVATVFAVLGAAWSKTSFALTLLRITRAGEGRTLYWTIWVIVVTLNSVLGFNAVIWFVYCEPAAGAWDANLHARCWERDVVVSYTEFAAAYSAAMDFVLAAVPWVVIMKLRMRLKEKLGVVVCMSLGVFAGCTSIMRSITVPTLYSNDYTYEAGQLFIWTGAELATTIVAASIPVLRALFSDLVGSKYHARGPVTELHTFQALKEGEGIRVTRETIVTRTPCGAEERRGGLAVLSPGLVDVEEGPLSPAVMTPELTYHSFLQPD